MNPSNRPENATPRRRAAKPRLAAMISGAVASLLFILAGTFWLQSHRGPGTEGAGPQEERPPEHDAVQQTLSPMAERQHLRAILENAISAQGGRIFIDRLVSLKKIGTLIEGESRVNTIYTYKRPNLVRYRLNHEERGSRFGYDGNRAWMQVFSAGRLRPARPLEGDDASGLILSAELAVPAVLLFEETQHMSLADRGEVEGHPCFILEYTGPNHSEQRFYIDQESYLLRQRTRLARLRGGHETMVEVVYSDFRTIDGIPLPFRETVYFDGEVRTILEIEEYVINPGILDEYFEMPGES